MRSRVLVRSALIGIALSAVLLTETLAASTSTGTTTNLSYTPTRINFGRHAPFSTTRRSVYVTNTSGAGMVFATAELWSGVGFYIPLSAATDSCFKFQSSPLPSGSTCSIDVGFMPPARGDYKSTLESDWSSNGGTTVTEATVTSLTGSGSAY